MSTTSVPAGSVLTVKQFSVALFTYNLRAATLGNNLTGPAPQQSEVESKLKGQTAPDYPVVRVTDLSKTVGDQVSMDLFNTITGFPLVGDVNAEGKGDKLTWSSMNARIDLLSKAIDAGGAMAQQRTKTQLRGIAMANLMGYFPRLDTQQMLVALAGGRGTQAGMDWVVPLQFTTNTGTTANTQFSDVMVNAVQAPTYNRHYVVSGTGFVQGGLQLGSITASDTLKLSHLDELRRIIDLMDLPLQPIKIVDDPAANDEPLYLLLVSPSAYSALITDATANNNLRAFQQYAWQRAQYGSKSPLFRGEVGMWNGILVKKINRSIRWVASENTKVVLVANRYTATESNQAINAGLAATSCVERSLLLGAQALANVYGKSQGSDFYADYRERTYNFDRNFEALCQMMNGKAKVRFGVPDGNGNTEPTDLGVFVIDSAAKV